MKTDSSKFITFSVIFILLIAVVTSLVFIFGKEDKKDNNSNKDNLASNPTCDSVTYTKQTSNPVAKMSTTKGCIILELYKNDAPKTVDNFIGLADKGYYNNLIFHRVIKDFMIQGGDPTGTGTGGESIYGSKFDDELNQNTQSYKTGYVKGVLAMANSGPNTNGSQFFITVADLNPDANNPSKQYALQKNYTIFGKVLVGQDVADQISLVQTDSNDKPTANVNIQKVEILK